MPQLHSNSVKSVTALVAGENIAFMIVSFSDPSLQVFPGGHMGQLTPSLRYPHSQGNEGTFTVAWGYVGYQKPPQVTPIATMVAILT